MCKPATACLSFSTPETILFVMCKREEQYKHARRLSYTCIFSKSVDEAVANLSRILLAGDNGFDEGSSFWAQLIDDICPMGVTKKS